MMVVEKKPLEKNRNLLGQKQRKVSKSNKQICSPAYGNGPPLFPTGFINGFFQKLFFSHNAAPIMSSLCRTGSCPRPGGLLGSKPPNPASIPSSSLTRAVAQLPITVTKPRAEQDCRNSNNITFQQKDFSATPKESRDSKIRTTKDLSRSAWVTSCRQPDIAFQQISGQWKRVKVFRNWEERCNWGKWGW